MIVLLRRLADPGAADGSPHAGVRQDAAALLRVRTTPLPSAIASSSTPRRPEAPELVEQLSEREIEVLRLLAAGRPNREIAAELFVTLDTVKKHVTHTFGKLGVANRTEAAVPR